MPDDFLNQFIKAQAGRSNSGRFSGKKALDQDELEDVLRTAGWPEQEIPRMSAIGMAESAVEKGPDGVTRALVNSYNPGVGPGGRKTVEQSIGPWQINMHPTLNRKYDRQRLASDPVYNAQVALEIFKTQGPKAWGAYTDGRYKQYLRQTGRAPVAGAAAAAPPDFTNEFIKQQAGRLPEITPTNPGAPAPVDFTEAFVQRQQQATGAPPPQVPASVPRVGAPPVTQTETLPTIEAQVTATRDAGNPRAAVLIQDPAQERALELSGFKKVKTPEGTLYVNPAKAKKLGITGNYGANLAKLIGKVEDNPQTATGPTVLTTDPQGNELASSRVSTPQAAEAQAAVDQATFPQAAQSQVVDAQDVVAKRGQDPNSYHNLPEGYRSAAAYHDQFERRLRELGYDVSEAPKSTDYSEFLRVTGLPDTPESQKEYQTAIAASNAGARTETAKDAAEAATGSDRLRQAVETAKQVTAGQQMGQTGQSRQIGRFNTNLDTEIGTTPVDPGLTPEQKLRSAMITQLGRYDVTPQEIDSYLKGAGADEVANVAKNPNIDQVGISFRVLRDIKGDAAAKFAIQSEQAQGRTDPNVGINTGASVEELYERLGYARTKDMADWLNSNAGTALTVLNPMFGVLDKETRDNIGASLAGGVVGSGARTWDLLAGAARPINTNIYKWMKSVAEPGHSLERQAGDGGIVSTLVKVAGGAPGDLSRLYLMTRIPGALGIGPFKAAVIGMAADSGLMSSGRGDDPAEIAKQTAKGGVLGAVFGAAPTIGRLVGETGATVTVGAGSAAVEKAFGATNEDALQTGLINTLFHLAGVLGRARLGNKVVRARDENGRSLKAGITPEGEIKLLKGKDAKIPADIEMVFNSKTGMYEVPGDATPVRTKPEPYSVGNRGNRIGSETPPPRQLEAANPQRIQQPDPAAIQKVSVDTRARKIVDALRGKDFVTIEEAAKAAKVNKVLAEDTVMQLYGAGMVEMLPGNKIRLINEAAPAADLYERAKTYGQEPAKPAAPAAEKPAKTTPAAPAETANKGFEIVEQRGERSDRIERRRAEQQVDVERRKTREERRRGDELETLANVNKLTGLGTKNAWEIAAPRIEADPNTSIVSFDVNRMKVANDTTSHAQVDKQVLAPLGQAITTVLNRHGIDKRQAFTPGGDEAYVAVPNDLAAKIRDEIEAEFGKKIIIAEKDYTNERTGETFAAGDRIPVTIAGSFGKTLAEAEVDLGARKEASKTANPIERRADIEAAKVKPDTYVEPTTAPMAAREAGRQTIDGTEYVRQPEIKEAVTGRKGKLKFAEAEPATDFEFRVLEAGQLQPAHMGGNRNRSHFLPEAQPKNRTDAASKAASDRIGQKPDLAQVGESPTAYAGAPVTNARGEVIQGNNRAEGLRKHYATGGTSYKEQLLRDADKFGLDPEKIRAMKEPVLIRAVDADDKQAIRLGNFSDLDMTSGGRQFVDPVATSGRIPNRTKGEITEDIFRDAPDDATLTELIRGTREKIKSHLAPYLTETQMQTLFNDQTKDFTPRGVKDIEAVFTHFLFDKGDIALPELFDALPHAAKQGMIQSLPKIFSVPDSESLVPEIQRAITAATDFKESGTDNWDTWLAQPDMLTGAAPMEMYTPVEQVLARKLFDARKQSEIKTIFADYATVVNGSEADMFTEARVGEPKPNAIKEIFGVDYVERPTTNPAADDDDAAETSPTGEDPVAAETGPGEGPARERARSVPAPATEGRRPQPAAVEPGPTRNFRAGTNNAKITFASELQRDLYDYYANEKKRMLGGGQRAYQTPPKDLSHLKTTIAKRLGIPEAEVYARAKAVSEDVKAQMKGVQDGEERTVTDNSARAKTAAVAEMIKGQKARQPDPEPLPAYMRSIARRELGKGRTAAEIADIYDLDTEAVKQLKEIGEHNVGDYGQTSYFIRRTLIKDENANLINKIAKVVVPEARIHENNPLFDRKTSIDAILDTMADRVGKLRSSELEPADWDKVLDVYADRIPVDAVFAIQEARAHQEEWFGKMTRLIDDFVDSDVVDDIIRQSEAVGAPTVTSFKETPDVRGKARETSLRGRLLKIGAKYAREKEGDITHTGLSRQAVERAFDIAIKRAIEARTDFRIARPGDLAANAPGNRQGQEAAEDIGNDLMFDRATDPDTLLAPNGQRSKLSPDLYRMVRTPEFKNWFGDWEKFATMEGGVWNDGDRQVSKVVDRETGEPLVVYHGTEKAGFSVFDESLGRKVPGAVFWTDSRYMARSYSGRNDEARPEIPTEEYEDDEIIPQPGVYSAFLNIRNPAEEHFEGANWDGDRSHQFEVLDEDGEQIYTEDGRGYFYDETDAQELADAHPGSEVHEARNFYTSTDDVAEQGMMYGQDGAIIREVQDSGPNLDAYDPADVFISTKPEQVKSIFNRGTFDPNDPNILYNRSLFEQDLFGNPLTPETEQASLFDVGTPKETGSSRNEAVDRNIGKNSADFLRSLEQSPNKKVSAAAATIIDQAQHAETPAAKRIIEDAADALDLFSRSVHTRTPIDDMIRQQWMGADVVITDRTKEFARQMAQGGNGFPKALKFATHETPATETPATAPEQPGLNDLLFHVAWHGSPHRFDRFDISKIGTGEGNQAYGHGLYFADKESVAEHYKQTLSARQTGDLLDVVDKDGNVLLTTPYDSEAWAVARDNPGATVEPHRAKTGAKYKVDLKPQEDEYLLWDRPISEQSEKVKKALTEAGFEIPDVPNLTAKQLHNRVDRFIDSKEFDSLWRSDIGIRESLRKLFDAHEAGIDTFAAWSRTPEGQRIMNGYIYNRGKRGIYNPSGENAYREIQYGQKGNPESRTQKEASEYLKSLGIRGIKYFDGSSRNKGEGAYNYVIFDDADVEITDIMFNRAAPEAAYLPSTGEIVNELRSHPLIKLKEKPKRVFVVGSFAKGAQNADSDIDVLLEVRPKADGTSELELADQYRRRLQQHFMRNNIKGKDDSVHPQWNGRRIDVYFTYDADKETRPKVELTDRQTQQPTPFKAWFGDSKVVDENGEPLRMYHGTGALDIEAFSDGVAFFTDNPKAADLYRRRSVFDGNFEGEFGDDASSVDELGDGGIDVYANEEGIDLDRGVLMPVYLKMEKPLDLTHLDANFDPENDWDELHDLGIVEEPWSDLDEYAQEEVVDEYGGKALWRFLDSEGHDTIRRAGYDGVIFNDVDTKGKTHSTWAVFKPTQIKSAIGNQGTFDPNNPGILYSKAGTDLGFFSQLERTVEQKMPNKASAEQVKALLRETKQEERDWLGIDDFLSQKPSFTKQEVLDFVRANQVQVEEVAKGEPDFDVESWWNDEGGANEEKPWDELTQTERANARLRYNDEVGQWSENATKFSQYTLPGGENYRELLLTLPADQPSAGPAAEVQAQSKPLDWFEAHGEWRAEELNGLYSSDWLIRDVGDEYELEYPNGRTSRSADLDELKSEAQDQSNGDAEYAAELENERRDRNAQEDAKKGLYRSSHWDEPNVLAHVRFDDRTVDGKKVLHVAEIQSDWHQEGRKKGYKSGDVKEITLDKITPGESSYEVEFSDGSRSAVGKGTIGPDASDEFVRGYFSNILKEKNDNLKRSEFEKTPDAPFKKSWHELAFKRVLRHAAENGYDAVTWDTGDTNAERYDLSKHIDELYFKVNDDGTVDLEGVKGEEAVITHHTTAEKLPDVVGKEIAEKILSGEGEDIRGESFYVENGIATPNKRLSGVDLKVGGSGMRGFYDKILPSFANKYAKKWGGKVQTGPYLETHDADVKPIERVGGGMWRVVGDDGRGIRFDDYENAQRFAKGEERMAVVHALKITPAMRESVMQGQPLFNRAPTAADLARQIKRLDTDEKLTPEKNLVAAHNLTENSLQFTEKLGGLAVPSIAITTRDSGFNSFGDITLLADPALVDPRNKVPVTDADMYSPRYPSAVYKFKPKQFEKYWEDVKKPYTEKYGPAGISSYESSWYNVLDNLQDNGPRALRTNPYFEAYFVASKGKGLPENPRDILDIITADRTVKAELEQFAQEEFDKLDPEMKMFKGYTYSGNRSYRPYTLENVVKKMKSEMKEGEGFNYGAGSIRAKAAKRFRTLAQIQADRGRIVTKADIENLKEEAGNGLLELANDLEPYHQHDSGLGFMDRVSDAIAEGSAPRGNLQRSLEEWGFKDVPDDLLRKIRSYVRDLTALPTEYFEAKPQRAVQLQEFQAAIVPKGISDKTRKILTRRGIDLFEYDPKVDGDRQRAMDEALAHPDHGNLLFDRTQATFGTDFPNERMQAQAMQLTRDLRTASRLKPADAAERAKATVDAQGVLTVNPEAATMLNRAVKNLVGQEPDLSTGLYGNRRIAAPLVNQLFTDARRSALPGAARFAEKAAEALASTGDFRDLTVVVRTPETSDVAKFTRQEELSHRAISRSGVKQQFVADIQMTKALKKTIAGVREQGYDIRMVDLLDEAFAKSLRDDAEQQLGITQAEIVDNWDTLITALEKAGITDDFIREVEHIGERGAQFGTYAKGKSNQRDRENAPGRPGETDPAAADQTEMRPEGARGRPAAGTQRVNDAIARLQERAVFTANRRGNGQGQELLSPADEIRFSKAAKARDLILDVLGSAKSAKASTDLSAGGRQGLILAPSHPLIFARAFFIEQLKSLKTSNFEKFKRDLDLHPYIELAEASKLYLGSIAGDSLAEREEQFISRLTGDEPYFDNRAAEKARRIATFGIRASERAYVTMLDYLRIRSFEKMAKAIHDANVRAGRPDDPAQFEGIAQFINYATGRGDLGRFNSAAPVLNTLFFSPRYWASRLQVLNPVFYAKLPPQARKQAIKSMMAFYAAVGAALLLLKAAGADVEFGDENNPDAMKVRLGNWRYEFTAGLIGHMRYLARMVVAATNPRGTYKTPKAQAKRMVDLTLSYGRSKLAPIPSSIVSGFQGEDFVGEPTGYVDELKKMYTPITIENISDAAKAEGVAGMLKSAPEVFGLGVSRYRTVDEIQKLMQVERDRYNAAPPGSRAKTEAMRRLKLWQKQLTKAERDKSELNQN
jgi:predicted nucleotidyltransferase/GGDEF domain-containing protein